MQINPSLRGVAVYLAVIQFFFFTTWIVYVVYLGDMLEDIGIGRDKLLWFILLDQVIFTISDTAMGFNADRIERLIGRIGPMIIGINAISCLAFALLPFISEINNGLGGQIIWVSLLIVWIASSSVLRAPPIVLLMKHAARPQVPVLSALMLLGLALGGAVSPYLGLVLKQMSPLVPFLLTGATLFLTTIGLIWMERLTRSGAVEKEPVERIPKKYFRPMLIALLGAGLFLGFGFQTHIFFNSKAHFLEFVTPDMLVWLLPVFWVGFKLFVYPGAAFARRFGTLDAMLLATPLGIICFSLIAANINLNSLIVAQLFAGAVWGILFMAGISFSISLGRGGDEGKVLGLWFSVLALSAVIRIIFAMSGATKQAEMQVVIDWLPALSWGIASSLLYIAWHYYGCYEKDKIDPASFVSPSHEPEI